MESMDVAQEGTSAASTPVVENGEFVLYLQQNAGRLCAKNVFCVFREFAKML